ncbi:uncharacterized protein LOC129285733 [Prosopis cineraria]|uniref:uncharacterized protein LOC129285733 n=1 Tax=Prosopis cineraria TaxID=364024 RepID=UPI00240F5B79|nr:uncharacterized protein LOC129285733 [Prosopis cineraria]
MKGIDVIIGMDCARKVALLLMLCAVVDSSKKPEFLSVVSAEKLIQQHCEAYMVFFTSSTMYDGGIEKFEVLSEFPEVFANEVTGLPPGREIEFSIDLVYGTELISKALYRMSPLKLDKLKKQIEDLLDKGFIRLSISF